MRKKIVSSYFVIILVLTTTFALIMMNSTNTMMTLQLEDRFINECELVKKLFIKEYKLQNTMDFNYMSFVNEIHKDIDTRITLIAEDGTVKADTHEDPVNMNNHLNRKEVIDAIRTDKVGTSVRYSNTVKADFLYVAIPVHIDGEMWIVRVSKQLVEIKELNQHILNVAVLSIISAAIFAMLMSIFVSKRITRPIDALTEIANEIADGDFGRKIYISANDQIGELAQSFNKMSHTLNLSMNELKQRNSELEAILNSMINGIIAVDQNKNIILINKFCFEILDLPQNYVVENESMYKIIRNEEIAQMVEISMNEGVPQMKELRYVHSEKTLRIFVNPIFTITREIIGSIVVIQDVTQIRKLEQMRSDFVSNVSHELKTPLTSIRGFVDTLKNGAVHQPDTAMRFLDIIDIESDRLYRLINDILLLSEIETMDREPEQTQVELTSVTEEVIDFLELKAHEKGLKLSAIYKEELFIKANRDRIKQMLINLIDNGIKYTEKGEVKVDIHTQGSWVVIRVTDTGIGFSEDHKERLFERFYRVDKGRSRNQGGTGLGLSIVKHIVLLYKGKIAVESTPGKGTTFEILLTNDDL
ncbi:ATP-binding protein [Fusibacter bizertensis]|uniref:histidine kinase n=1 Tax=Fusibacter bizertensis TaxID=1488331 RepID=A0ABT6N9Z1_9FIRM|nr:ATP-binding protein [Fusibacter bizertensis]MDH8677237.1 ATP-binding protein [Fusibacter bizertensis]